MRLTLTFLFTVITMLYYNCNVYSQGYLHTEGKKIVDSNNNEVILISMNTGNWMVQEGYMMGTEGVFGPQHEIRAGIEDLIGPADTDLFYEAWLDNYLSKKDVDSLAAWGFNSIRLPIHYNLFTLPIEDEPVPGQNTWLTKGFELTDQVLEWCEANNMYLIIDLHAAPGGQGANADISDYDATKPSLWESAENRSKTVALWRKIAERYANEPMIGGYDLINETNWDIPNNTLLRQLSEDITYAIREVDNNHIIFIEGNGFANDFTNMTPPWDTNVVYAPHKYWSKNETEDIQWVLDIREQYNVPLWFGETGENSNAWFTEASKLWDQHGIGRAWWPMKKFGSVAGIITVEKTPEYDQLLDYWHGRTNVRPSAAFAKSALMGMIEQQKLENCKINYDVLDALFRQTTTNETVPYSSVSIPGTIYAPEYDYGTQGFAYSDNEYADYHLTTGSWNGWNNGWIFRNDGVDIEPSSDNQESNGYMVGWTEEGDWMQYTVNVNQKGAYRLRLRYATNSGGIFHIESNGKDVSGPISVGSTGSYTNWSSHNAEYVMLDAGENKIRFVIDQPGFNFTKFELHSPVSQSSVDTKYLSSVTLNNEKSVILTFNKPLNTFDVNNSGFSLKVNGGEKALENVVLSSSNQVTLSINDVMFYTDEIRVSYNGNAVSSTDGRGLSHFHDQLVVNNIAPRFEIPGRVEAEDYVEMSGIGLENPTGDRDGGGANIGYLHPGDWADYQVYSAVDGVYKVDFRVASNFENGGELQLQMNNQVLSTTSIPGTNGWANYIVVSDTLEIDAGSNTLRMYVPSYGEYNLNWMDFTLLSLKGVIEAEDYIAQNGTQTENCQDAGGGLNVGFIDDNDWMDYQIDLAQGGEYTVEFRYASQNGGSELALLNDGQQLSVTTLSATNGWQNWSTASTVVNLNAGTSTLRLLAQRGGYNVNWLKLTLNTPCVPPTIDLGSDVSICQGETVTLSSPDTFTSYFWSTGESTQSIEVGVEGDYSLTVTDQFGCQNTDVIHVSVTNGPTLTPRFSINGGITQSGSTVVVDEGMSFQLIAVNASVDNWQWSGPSNFSATTSSVSLSNVNTLDGGTYTVSSIGTNGCSSSVSFNVVVNGVDLVSPSTPTNLNASNITTSDLLLSWSASLDNVGVQEYEVYQDGSFIGSTSSTSIQINNLLEETTYLYSIIAVDEAGNTSSESSSLSVTTLAAPTEVVLFQNNNGGDKMEVTDGQDGAQEFRYGSNGSNYQITKVGVYLSKEKSPNGNLILSVGTSRNGGRISDEVGISANQVTNNSEGKNFTYFEFVLPNPVDLQGNQRYYLNFHSQASNGDKYYFEYDPNNQYNNGNWFKDGSNDGKDIRFKVYGSESSGSRSKTASLNLNDELNEIIAYPNPSNGRDVGLRVPNNFRESSVVIYNLQGRIVHTQDLKSASSTKVIYFKNMLSAGYYILRLNNGKEIKTANLIIK